MTVQEIMERAKTKETNLVIALIKDAVHLIRSQYNEDTKEFTTDLIDGIRDYPMPMDMVKLVSISIKDTNDDKYKKIRRLAFSPTVVKDNSPN